MQTHPTLETILSRRSIRNFKPNGTIPEETVEQLLRAAMSAPSARDKQPWRFVVCQEKNSLEKLSKIHPYGAMLSQASMAILVCGDAKDEETDSYMVQTCSAATQNLLLAAHALGLGAVWLGVHPRVKRMCNLSLFFQLPDHITPVALISLGIPDEQKLPNNHYDPAKIYYEKWS